MYEEGVHIPADIVGVGSSLIDLGAEKQSEIINSNRAEKFSEV